MLSHARVYPGTELAYDSDMDLLEQDIARGLVDLQIALGIDTDSDGDIEATEWLYDASGDDPTNVLWNGPGGDWPPLRYVRINSLTRTERPDPGFLAEPLASIEDRAYNELAVPTTTAERNERSYRRRTFQTTLTVRNI